MNFMDVENQKWNIDKDLKVGYNRLNSLTRVEQEMNITWLRAAMEDESKQEVRIVCSHQSGITMLAKSEFFTLTEVLISNHKDAKGFVLEVKGILEVKALRIRKNKTKMSEEKRKELSERMKSIQKSNVARTI